MSRIIIVLSSNFSNNQSISILNKTNTFSLITINSTKIISTHSKNPKSTQYSLLLYINKTTFFLISVIAIPKILMNHINQLPRK